MKYPKCKSCGRAVIGRQHKWGNIQPLCRNCYAFRCRTTIKTSNLLRKLVQRNRDRRPAARQVRPRGFWSWLFG
jgi:hypothetical protein